MPSRVSIALLTIATALASAAPTAARAQADDLPPAFILKGPPLPGALVIGLRQQVRDAITETERHVGTVEVAKAREASSSTANRKGAAGPWRRLTCEVRDVRIELHSAGVPTSSVAAVVMGRALASVSGSYPTPAAASEGRSQSAAGGGAAGPGAAGRGQHTTTVAFSLLYVLPPEQRDRGDRVWRLALAQYRPEPDASRGTASPGGAGAAAGPNEPAWRDLWSGESGSVQQPRCLIAATWRDLGRQ